MSGQNPPDRDVLLASADLKERRLLFAELGEAGYDVSPLPDLSYAIRAVLLRLVWPRLILLDVCGDRHATPAEVERLLKSVPGVPVVLIAGTLLRESWEPLRPRLAALLHRPISIGEVVDVVRRALPLTIFLCGDTMTGRGVDQVLPHPGDPTLYESHVRDARDYVRLAEQAHGAIERPVSFEYIWGDALTHLRSGVDLRIVNLETSITERNDPWPDKPVLYRMHPENVGCLTAAGIDCCCLANNHVLDWGRAGLVETLEVLDRAGLHRAGAGHRLREAQAPAVLKTAGGGRVLVHAVGSVTSGIPAEWAASGDSPGVHLLEDLSEESACRLAAEVRRSKKPGDLALVSIHWGPNWGYHIPQEQIRFAHQLVEEGVDLIHGHSSHHVKSLEVYRGRLILYGCGDFLTDYEGIGGYEAFRGDLAVMYFVKVIPSQARLVEVRLVPMQLRRFRLNRASQADAAWLCETMNREARGLATAVRLDADGTMTVPLTDHADK